MSTQRVTILAKDVCPGDDVRLGGQWQRVWDAGPGGMPNHTALATALDTYQFPDLAVLEIAYPDPQ